MLVASRRAAFERHRIARNLRHRGLPAVAPDRDQLATLQRDGIVVLRGKAPREKVERLRVELDACLDSADLVDLPENDARRAAANDDRPGTIVDADEIEHGPDSYRHLTNSIAILEPFVSCPTVADLAFDESTLALVWSYLRSPAAVGGIDLRRSFANEIPGVGDRYKFHCDPNAFKMVKVFHYLTDVDEDSGPLLYVRGSQRERFPGWTGKYLWSRDEMLEHYGEDRVMAMTGKAGDVMVADTSAFHTGMKPRQHDRSILIVNYVLHEELNGRHPWLHLPAAEFDQLDAEQRVAAELLRVDPLADSAPSPRHI